MRTHIRKPWVSAALAAVVVVLTPLASLVLTGHGLTDRAEDAASPLSPDGLEVGFAFLSVAVLYLGLWALFALAARFPVRRAQGDSHSCRR